MRVEETVTYNIIKDTYSEKELEAIAFNSEATNRLISALDNAYVNKSAISVPYWEDELGVEFVEMFTFICKDLLDIEIRNKYASIAINNRKVLAYFDNKFRAVVEYRRRRKLSKYMPRLVEDVQPANLVKTPSGVKETGLIRSGFAKSANVKYSYDIDMLLKYYESILENTQKSMRKIAKKYDYVMDDTSGYARISELVLEQIIANEDQEYNLENNVSDQRGRAIYGGLKRVFNPVGYKDARALLKIAPRTITTGDREAIDNIYSFIAELNGKKRQRYATKILAGMVAYKRKELPNLDLNDEEDRKDLHERIWLERIYTQLDELFINGSVEWIVPIEVDASMSMAQVIGCLTGDKRLLDKTNVINKGNLQDPWHIEGVRRLSAKKAGTPIFYGSSATVTALLKNANIDIDREEVKALRKEFNKGAFSVIKAFKDALIKTSNVETPTYMVQGWGEAYEVEVNKYKASGETEYRPYMVWDPKKNRTKTFFMHKPYRVPDYGRFKLYMATGLVHNLDSKIADTVCNAVDGVIAIHDAFIVHPLDTQKVREVYADQLNKLYRDRNKIIADYRQSIGAIGPKADKALAKVVELTEPVSNFKAEVSALK